MKPVAIIGGGITGLTAAFELKKRNVPVTLYEGAQRVGGPIRTVRERGYLAECGPNTILETSPLISQLVRELDLEPRRLYSDAAASNRYIAKNGRPVPLPSSAREFLATPLFSTRAKLRLALEPFIPRSKASANETVADFVVRRLGPEFLDYAINPLVGGVYAGDPHRLSLKQAFPKLHALEQRYGSLIAGQVLGARERKRQGSVSKQNAPKFSFDEGLDVLTNTLHERMRDSILLGHRIRELRRTSEGWTVVAGGATGEVEEEHSAIIVAIPALDLANIAIEGISALSLTPLRNVYYPPVASVVLGFRREDVQHPLDGFGVLVPEAERMKILGTIFSSSLFPGRAPAGHITLTSYLGGARSPELALTSEETLVANTLKDLRVLFGIMGPPTYAHSFVFRNAIPQYNIGYERFKHLMGQVEEAAPGLVIGGHCRCGISLGDSIASGFEMADRVEDYISSLKTNSRREPIYA